MVTPLFQSYTECEVKFSVIVIVDDRRRWHRNRWDSTRSAYPQSTYLAKIMIGDITRFTIEFARELPKRDSWRPLNSRYPLTAVMYYDASLMSPQR